MFDKSKSVKSDSKEDINSKAEYSSRFSRKDILNRYDNFLDLLPIIIYIIEPRPPYIPIYISKSIEMLGYTEEDWSNIPDFWINTIYKDDREKFLKETENAIRERHETDFEYRICARDNSIRWFQDKKRFIFDETGQVIYLECFLIDITPRKRLEDQIRQIQNFANKGFAENIVLDLKDMLTVIGGYTDLGMLRTDKTDPVQTYLREIKKAADRIAELLKQLNA